MPSEGFFQRWSRLKTEPAEPAVQASPGPGSPALTPAAPPGLAPQAAPQLAPALPSAGAAPHTVRGDQQLDGDGAPPRRLGMEDVAQLHRGSDYSAFVARGVDKAVQRSALKKLFADPHFNSGDGLDLYMGDYNKPDPIPAAMMSALRHSRSFFAAAYPERQADEAEPDDLAPDTPGTGDPQALADIDAPAIDSVDPTSTTGAIRAATGDKA